MKSGSITIVSTRTKTYKGRLGGTAPRRNEDENEHRLETCPKDPAKGWLVLGCVADRPWMKSEAWLSSVPDGTSAPLGRPGGFPLTDGGVGYGRTFQLVKNEDGDEEPTANSCSSFSMDFQ